MLFTWFIMLIAYLILWYVAHVNVLCLFHVLQGFLLYGPPGTGKTLIAKAVAAEAGLPILVAQPCHIVDKYIGNSSQNVRLLFRLVCNLICSKVLMHCWVKTFTVTVIILLNCDCTFCQLITYIYMHHVCIYMIYVFVACVLVVKLYVLHLT